MRLCQSKLNSLGGYSRLDGIGNDGKRKITELKTKIKNKIQELKNKVNSATDTEKLDLKARIKELEKAVVELEKLERTVTKYNFEIDKEAAQLNYDNNTDTVTVKYDGTLGSLINELKHAFQFETGQLDFIQVANSDGSATNIPGVLYDLRDELETYKRQYAYDGFLKMRMAWTEKELNNFLLTNISELNRTFKIISEEQNNVGVLEARSMKYITVDIIVKIKDTVSDRSKLYSSLSTKSLDKNSSLRQIERNNTNRGDLGNLSWMGLDSFKKKKTPYIEFVKVFIKEKPFIHVK